MYFEYSGVHVYVGHYVHLYLFKMIKWFDRQINTSLSLVENTK